MSISRRHFLRAGAVVAMAAGTPLTLTTLAAVNKTRIGGATGDALHPATNLARMNKAMFAAQLRTTFFMHLAGAQQLPVRLVEIEDWVPAAQQTAAALHGQECFSLAFQAATHQPLAQKTYQFEHPTLGRFELFVGPVKSKQHGAVYEAIINHLHA